MTFEEPSFLQFHTSTNMVSILNMLLRKLDRASPWVNEGPVQRIVSCRQQNRIAQSYKPMCLLMLLMTTA